MQVLSVTTVPVDGSLPRLGGRFLTYVRNDKLRMMSSRTEDPALSGRSVRDLKFSHTEVTDVWLPVLAPILK